MRIASRFIDSDWYTLERGIIAVRTILATLSLSLFTLINMAVKSVEVECRKPLMKTDVN